MNSSSAQASVSSHLRAGGRVGPWAAALGVCCATFGTAGAAEADTGNYIARYTASGALDSSFGTGGVTKGNPPGFDALYSVAFSPFGDRTLTAVGVITPSGGSLQKVIIGRYTDKGVADTSFGFLGVNTIESSSTATEEATAIGFQSSQKIILAGVTTEPAEGGSHIFVARLGFNGILDTTFGRSGFNFALHSLGERVSGLKIAADNSIFVSAQVNGRCVVAKFTSDGGRDSSFGADHSGVIQFDPAGGQGDVVGGIALDTSGRVLVSCTDLLAPLVTVARITPGGILDGTWGQGGLLTIPYTGVTAPQAMDLAVDSSNRVVTLASFKDSSGKGVIGLTRYSSVGLPDDGFGRPTLMFPGATNIGGSNVRLRGDGAIVVLGGGFTSSNGLLILLARLTNSGQLDPSFGAGTGKVVSTFQGLSGIEGLGLDDSNRIIVVGTSN